MSYLLQTFASRQCVLRFHTPCHRIAGQRRNISIKQLDASRNHRERIVILGSGWAGYNLARSLDPHKFQTVIVSPRSYFVFTPLLASTSVGTLESRTALEPVRSRNSKYEYVQGRADGIDPGKKQIIIRETVRCPNQGLLSTRAGEERDERPIQMKLEASRGELFSMAYDKLVIGVGSYSQTFGIPGVKDHAFFLKDVNDARKIRDKLLSCFETAALPTTPVALQKQLLSFAIVGKLDYLIAEKARRWLINHRRGPTGIECSGELSDIVRDDLSRLYPHLTEHVQITVYDVADKILPMFDEKLSKYAQEHARREGVAIRTSHSIRELRRGFPRVAGAGAVDYHDDVKASGYTLAMKNGEDAEVGCGLVVWSTGLMANPFLEKCLSLSFARPTSRVEMTSHSGSSEAKWSVQRHARSGSIMTDDILRVQLLAADSEQTKAMA